MILPALRLSVLFTVLSPLLDSGDDDDVSRELVWSGLDWSGLDWTLNWTGLDCTCPLNGSSETWIIRYRLIIPRLTDGTEEKTETEDTLIFRRVRVFGNYGASNVPRAVAL